MPYDKRASDLPQGATGPTGGQLDTPTGAARVTLNEDQRQKLLDMVYNVEFSRRRLFQMMMDPRRDIFDECGYPKANPSAEEYYDLYDRDALAARVVEIWPKESWKVFPEVYEDEDEDVETEFESAWKELIKTLKPEKSFFRDSDKTVWDYFERLDILSGIGRYGVMLIGFNDVTGDDLTPAVKKSQSLKINFLRVFPESLAKISTYDTDVTSPRYGLPQSYSLTFHDPKDDLQGIGSTTTTRVVHWTRVIHVPSDGAANSSEFIGKERMRQVLNDILDGRKVRGAYSEGYWKSCFTLLTAETHPSLGGDVDVNKQEMKDMFEEMMNGLQRHGVLEGMTLKSTAPAVIDPSPFYDKTIETICVKLEVPVPVFKGYEIGEQASTENKTLWNDRVAKRQNVWCTVRLVVPFVDRLILLGILPEPEQFCVHWPDLNKKSDKDKGDVALRFTQALAQYVSSGLSAFMTFSDYCIKVLGWDAEEVEQFKDNVNEETDEDDKLSPMVSQPQALSALIELFKAAHEGAVSEEQLKEVMVSFFGITERQADDMIGSGLLPTAKELEPAPAAPTEPPTSNELLWDFETDEELTENAKKALTGGRWVTTDEGHRVYIKAGKPVAGNPAVVAQMKGEQGGTATKKSEAGKRRDAADKVINDPEVIKDLKVPEFLYHMTSRANLESIQKEGLKFGGPRATSSGEIRGVYLSWSSRPEDIQKAGGDFNVKDVVMLKVSTKDLKLRLDPEYFDGTTKEDAKRWVKDINDGASDYAMYSPKAISPKNITVHK